MLLVDDHKGEPLEDDVLRKHGVGTEEHRELARSESILDGRPLIGRRRTREQRPRNPRLIEQRAALHRVLLSEHTRRGHHACLGMRVGDRGERHARDGRLARTHIAQKKPVHDVGAFGHVVKYLAHGAFLLIGEGERQRVAQSSNMRAGHMRDGVNIEQVGIVAKAKRELQEEELIIGQALPGLVTLIK